MHLHAVEMYDRRFSAPQATLHPALYSKALVQPTAASATLQERDCMHQATQRASESIRAGGMVHAPGHTKGIIAFTRLFIRYARALEQRMECMH